MQNSTSSTNSSTSELVYIPYPIIFIILLLLAVASFIRYHLKNKTKYEIRRYKESLPTTRFKMMEGHIDVSMIINRIMVEEVKNYEMLKNDSQGDSGTSSNNTSQTKALGN